MSLAGHPNAKGPTCLTGEPFAHGTSSRQNRFPAWCSGKLTGFAGANRDSPKERENGLRRGVGLRKRGRTGLLQDLKLDQLPLLLGEVGVVDAAASCFVVRHRDLQIVLLEGEALLVVANVRQKACDGVDLAIDGG